MHSHLNYFYIFLKKNHYLHCSLLLFISIYQVSIILFFRSVFWLILIIFFLFPSFYEYFQVFYLSIHHQYRYLHYQKLAKTIINKFISLFRFSISPDSLYLLILLKILNLHKNFYHKFFPHHRCLNFFNAFSNILAYNFL